MPCTLPQSGKKHEQARPLHGFGSAGVLEMVEDWRGNAYRAVYTVRYAAAVFVFARVSEEGNERDCHAQTGHGIEQRAAEGRRAGRKGAMKMSKRKVKGVEVVMGTGNVYADLGYGNADEMVIKAQLVTKIAEIIKRKGLTQTKAAALLGMPQPKLSNLLRGQFRGFSERRLMDCLTRLGRDVQIVVKAAPRSRENGRLSIVFA